MFHRQRTGDRGEALFGDGELALAGRDADGTGQGSRAALDVVDGDLGALDVCSELERGDARLELLQEPFDLLDPIRRYVSASVAEVAREGILRRHVVLYLEVGLPDVVQHAEVRRDLVGPLKLEDRGAKVVVLIQLDAALEALPGVFVGGLRRRRGRRLSVGRRREGEREAEGQPCPGEFRGDRLERAIVDHRGLGASAT